MSQSNKKLTGMIWRSVGESILLSLFLAGVSIYFLYSHGYLRLSANWWREIKMLLILLTMIASAGAVFGYWTIGRIRGRLDELYESMLFLEKGNLSRPIPELGEDEVGRLAVQLGRIGKKWEEQVSSLQRLSTDNAKLAEKARYSAIMEERQRLARELHDAVSQQLFAISMTATAVGRTLDHDFDKAKQQISLIEEMSSVAQSEMRALLLHLRPVHLEGKKLGSGLKELLKELKSKVPMEISSEIDENIRLSKGMEDHLFRIVQEALSNALRHSRAGKLELKFYRHMDVIRLSVSDDGIGFDSDVKKHASYGIVSMQERVNELGGVFNIVTAPGKGTRIDIRIPIMMEEGETHVGQNN